MTISTPAGKQELRADNVILALGMKSDNNLAERLKKEGLEPVVIGDSLKPRRIIDAVWEGYRRARIA